MKRSAAERLQAAKLEIKRTEKRLDDAVAARRQCLIDGDANGTAAIRADDAIAALRLLRLRYIDQVELFAPLVVQEQRETWPSSLPDARRALDDTTAALAWLERVPKLDRSAALDQQTDHARQRQWALQKLVQRLQPSEDAA